MSDARLCMVAAETGMYRPDQKIRMIKDYRSCFKIVDWAGNPSVTMSLREAKEDCDRMMEGESVSKTLTRNQIEALTYAGFHINSKYFEVNKRRNVSIYAPKVSGTGSKIECIKRLRGALGIGLKEAKEIIDEMWGTFRHVEVRNVSERKIQNLIDAGFDVRGYVKEHFESENDLFKI
ncbi:MAG: hypothetical protein GWO20_10165 [Candidatus Korarchaeota archaeon]|nr:hypothetical protein [Candidatus Korarchaeota archaeon]NIU83881.1 hypothetical protein [Candidatus Thorarchaeota archaeon]NIW14027.1 hypothetical protein [Candidatus Thorarchaeota archaeon]